MNSPRYLSTKLDWQDPKVANAFDTLPFWCSPFGNLFFDHIPLRTGMNVLDVGFGTGFPLLELAERLGPSSKVTGIDPWSGAVARARRKASALKIEDVQIIEADAEVMPLEDNQFDMIVSHLGINNFDNKDLVLQECIRVLKNEGTLALVSNLNGTFREFYQVFYETLNELQCSQYVPALQQQEAHRPTQDQIRDWLTSNGFHITRQVDHTHYMRYLNGTAFLNSSLSIIGFLPSWLALFPESEHNKIFTQLESNLNRYAERHGELKLEVPMVYVEGELSVVRSL